MCSSTAYLDVDRVIWFQVFLQSRSKAKHEILVGFSHQNHFTRFRDNVNISQTQTKAKEWISNQPEKVTQIRFKTQPKSRSKVLELLTRGLCQKEIVDKLGVSNALICRLSQPGNMAIIKENVKKKIIRRTMYLESWPTTRRTISILPTTWKRSGVPLNECSMNHMQKGMCLIH